MSSDTILVGQVPVHLSDLTAAARMQPSIKYWDADDWRMAFQAAAEIVEQQRETLRQLSVDPLELIDRRIKNELGEDATYRIEIGDSVEQPTLSAWSNDGYYIYGSGPTIDALLAEAKKDLQQKEEAAKQSDAEAASA